MEIISKSIEKEVRKGFGYSQIDYGLSDEDIAEQFEISHKKRKEVVRQVLDGWEKARNSDTLLYWECLRLEFPDIQVTSSKDNIIFKIPKQLVKFLPSPESYRRPRQQFNHKGLFLPTIQSVIDRRCKREKAMREHFAKLKYQEKAKIVK